MARNGDVSSSPSGSVVNFAIFHQLCSWCSKLSLSRQVCSFTSSHDCPSILVCCAVCQSCCFASVRQHTCNSQRRRLLVTLQLGLDGAKSVDAVQHPLNHILVSSSPCHQAQAGFVHSVRRDHDHHFSFAVSRPICSECVGNRDDWDFIPIEFLALVMSVRTLRTHTDLTPRSEGTMCQLVRYPFSCCWFVGVWVCWWGEGGRERGVEGGAAGWRRWFAGCFGVVLSGWFFLVLFRLRLRFLWCSLAALVEGVSSRSNMIHCCTYSS